MKNKEVNNYRESCLYQFLLTVSIILNQMAFIWAIYTIIVVTKGVDNSSIDLLAACVSGFVAYEVLKEMFYMMTVDIPSLFDGRGRKFNDKGKDNKRTYFGSVVSSLMDLTLSIATMKFLKSKPKEGQHHS